ncbi:MAG: hypothetical protein ACE5JM_15220, partial [Armatimonadota bacterium]
MAPSILIFTRKLDGDLTSLVKASDKFISTHKGMTGFVVVVGDREKLQARVKDLASKQKLAIPLTFPAGGPDARDVQKYKLNPQVAHTVLVYNNKKVTSNFALQKIGAEDI